MALRQEQEVEDLDRERDEAGQRGDRAGEGAAHGRRQGDVLEGHGEGRLGLELRGRDPRGEGRPGRRPRDQRDDHHAERQRTEVGGVKALEEAAAESEADDDHAAVDHAAADPLGDAGDLGVQRPGEHGGRDEAGAQRERDRTDADQLAGREVDERGREHQGEAVGDQHEDEQVAARNLGDVGVGRDERRGRRGGDQEEAEAERIVEPDGEPDERQGKRGEREVQAEQDQPGPQVDRPLSPGQRPHREQRLQAEGRHGEGARGARR